MHSGLPMNAQNKPDEKDAVAFLAYLVSEAEDTMDSHKERTPFDAVWSGIQNANDTHGWWPADGKNAVWARCAVDSIRSNCRDSEPDEVCQWFEARGLTY